jgi:hypothetical protein
LIKFQQKVASLAVQIEVLQIEVLQIERAAAAAACRAFIVFIVFQGEGGHARKAATSSKVGGPIDPRHICSEA